MDQQAISSVMSFAESAQLFLTGGGLVAILVMFFRMGRLFEKVEAQGKSIERVERSIERLEKSLEHITNILNSMDGRLNRLEVRVEERTLRVIHTERTGTEEKK
jgi:hypothetical protein